MLKNLLPFFQYTYKSILHPHIYFMKSNINESLLKNMFLKIKFKNKSNKTVKMFIYYLFLTV